MKTYIIATLAIVVLATAISGLAAGGWDVLVPKIIGFLLAP